VKRSGPIPRYTRLRATKPINRISKRKRKADRIYAKNRAAAMEATGYRCIECGQPATGGTHHAKFRSAGGGHAGENLRPLCLTCHGREHGIKVITDSRPMWSGKGAR
jgi:5-methylcytosine-specific restriction endonuclease McrA